MSAVDRIPDAVRSSPGAGNPMRWRTLAVTQLAAFMALLDVSIVNVALPSIERGLGVSAGTAQWVVSGYALSFGLALVPAGRLGDALGRRRMLLIALGAFVLTSALTGAAPTIGLLIAARLLQGVAGGMLLPQNSGLIQEMFQGAERGKAFGILGATVGLATATGPVVGGLIITSIAGPDAWRWVFYVNVPIGLLALLLAARWVPKRSGGGRRDTHLDLIGSLLLGGGVLCLLLPAVDAESNGLGQDWWLLAAAVVLLTAFARWELHTVRRGRQPVLDPRLAHTSGFAAGSAIGLVYFIGFTGIWLVLALYFQDGLGYSPLRSGLAVTPFAIGVAVSCGDRRPPGVEGRPRPDRGRPDRDDCGARRHSPPVAACRWRRRRVGRRRSPAGCWTRRWHGHLPQCHAVLAARPGTDGRLGRWRLTDRSANRLRDRHRHTRNDLLPRPDELCPQLSDGGVRRTAECLRAHAPRSADSHHRPRPPHRRERRMNTHASTTMVSGRQRPAHCLARAGVLAGPAEAFADVLQPDAELVPIDHGHRHRRGRGRVVAVATASLVVTLVIGPTWLYSVTRGSPFELRRPGSADGDLDQRGVTTANTWWNPTTSIFPMRKLCSLIRSTVA